MAYYVYIIQCANNHFYTGWSTDPLRRLKQHNAGKGSRYTRVYGPCELVYAEEVADMSCALKREFRVKKLTHPQKHRLIANEQLNCLVRLIGTADSLPPPE
ncbi:MAG: GIY-YIG nuclease family protein [Chloroflexi bacterium]|jgi:putative endonuclease|nr:GIY-YIG nuclease family protein [Chloroflexota bacterium]